MSASLNAEMGAEMGSEIGLERGLEMVPPPSPTVGAALRSSVSEGLHAIGGFAQINLLEKRIEVRESALAWWVPLACTGLVAAVALASGWQLNPRLAALKARALATEAKVAEQTQRMEAASQQNKSGTAKDQAQALRAALTQQERLLALMGGVAPAALEPARPDAAVVATTSQDFSALLEGLSRTRVDGLWLTQVRLDRRTQEVRLEGQTRNAQWVSTYIDELTRNPRFKGLVLSAVEVSRPEARGAAAADATELAKFKLVSTVATASPPNSPPNPPANASAKAPTTTPTTASNGPATATSPGNKP
jgi:hypothetical protein